MFVTNMACTEAVLALTQLIRGYAIVKKRRPLLRRRLFSVHCLRRKWRGFEPAAVVAGRGPRWARNRWLKFETLVNPQRGPGFPKMGAAASRRQAARPGDAEKLLMYSTGSNCVRRFEVAAHRRQGRACSPNGRPPPAKVCGNSPPRTGRFGAPGRPGRTVVARTGCCTSSGGAVSESR